MHPFPLSKAQFPHSCLTISSYQWHQCATCQLLEKYQTDVLEVILGFWAKITHSGEGVFVPNLPFIYWNVAMFIDFGDETSTEVIKAKLSHKRRACSDWLRVLLIISKLSSLILPVHMYHRMIMWGHSKTEITCKPQRQFSFETDYTGTLLVDLQTPKWWRSIILLLNWPMCFILLWQLKHPMQDIRVGFC